MNQIHPTSIVDPQAQLGENITVGPYCTIGPHVQLGDHCHLRSHVVLEGHTTIGSHNTFFPFAIIGTLPQDLKHANEDTTLEIGSHNTFRESCSVHIGTVHGGGVTKVGNHGLFMAYTHIAHDCEIGDHVIMANSSELSGHVILEDHVTLGGQNGVVQFVRIGAYSYIGAGTLIDQSLPPYTRGQGNRIRVKGINHVGMERRGFSKDEVKAVFKAHSLFYKKGLEPQEAVEQIDALFPDMSAVQRFTQFIRNEDYQVKKG